MKNDKGSQNTRLENVRVAMSMIRNARDYLRAAGAANAANYAARALKSAEGAERHALRLERASDVLAADATLAACRKELHKAALAESDELKAAAQRAGPRAKRRCCASRPRGFRGARP